MVRQKVTWSSQKFIGQIFGKAFSTDYTNQYKVRKAFSFYKSGFVYIVYVKTINTEGVLLKAAVTPSQRIRDESHKVWVLIKLSGEVVGGFCTCIQNLRENTGSYTHPVLKEHVLGITLVIKTYSLRGYKIW